MGISLGCPDEGLLLQVSDKGVSHLRELVQLRRLALQGTAISSSMLVVGGFSELEALDVAWTAVNSQGLYPLATTPARFSLKVSKMQAADSSLPVFLNFFAQSVTASSPASTLSKHGETVLCVLSTPLSGWLGGLSKIEPCR